MPDIEKRLEEISRILARSVGSSLSETEQTILDKWLSESPENMAVYGKLRDEVYLNEQYTQYVGSNYDNGWEELLGKIAHRHKKRALLRGLMRYAAAVAVAAVAVWGVIAIANDNYDSKDDIAAIMPGHSRATLQMEDGLVVVLDIGSPKPLEALSKHGISADDTELVYDSKTVDESKKAEAEPAMHVLTVPRGGEYKLVLSDGTTVWLNSETTLRYPVRFTDSERRVELIGEGFFDVAADVEKRFIVTAKGVDIAVTGTTFNIMSYEDNEYVETTLVSGRVNIMTDMRNVALVPGRQALYCVEDESINVYSVDTRPYTAWKDGFFEFEGMSLESICKLLGRWYNVDFAFDNPQVAKLTFTGAAKKERTLLFILDLISDTRSIKYEMINEQIVLSIK